MEFGWKRIWALYGWKELFSWRNKLFYFSVITVMIFIIFILVSNHAVNLPFELIQKVVDIAIGSLPTLLGFNLGAFALIIGFLSNKNLITALTERHGSESSYQIEKISGIFAINIIVQAFALLFSFLLRLVIEVINKVEFRGITKWIVPNVLLANSVNYIVLYIISFLSLYSITLVIQNAINIFDFNQLFTYFSVKEDKCEKK